MSRAALWAAGPVAASLIIAGVIAATLTGNPVWGLGLGGLAVLMLCWVLWSMFKDRDDAAVDEIPDESQLDLIERVMSEGDVRSGHRWKGDF